MKKRFFTLVCALFLVGTLVTISALAAENVGSSLKIADTDSICAIAEEFLSASTRNIYLYENNDFDALTIASMPATYADNDVLIAIDNESKSLTDFRANIELVDGKVEYYKYLRSSQDMLVNDFTQDYTIKDIKIYDNTAVVVINELLFWQYADYDRLSGASTDYEVTLIKVDGNWLVAEIVAPNDFFDRKYIIGEETFVLEDRLAAVDDSLAREKAAIQAAEAQGISFDSNTQTRARGYDVAAAVEYAQDWALKRNSIFKEYTKDCMNFASQCVYVGLGGKATKIDYAYMDKSGRSKWFWDDEDSWCSCFSFRNYVNGVDPILNTDIYEISSGSSIPFWYSGNIEGSVAHVDGSAGKWSHAIFLVDSRSPSRSDIYFCAHTDDKLNEKLSAHYLDDEMYFIGIN